MKACRCFGGKPVKFGVIGVFNSCVREANGGADFGCTVHPDVGQEQDRGPVAFAVSLGSSAVLTPIQCLKLKV